MAKFSAMSFNCNGIGEKNKRQKIFTYKNDKIKHGFVSSKKLTQPLLMKINEKVNGMVSYIFHMAQAIQPVVLFSFQNHFP